MCPVEPVTSSSDLSSLKDMEKDKEKELEMKNVTKRKKFRILSISGGGTRGIIPSLILLRLEQITGHHPCELFDLMVGTSTGAMICGVLTIPKMEPVEPVESVKQSAEPDVSTNAAVAADDTSESSGLPETLVVSAPGAETVALETSSQSQQSDPLLQPQQSQQIQQPQPSQQQYRVAGYKYSAKDLLDVYIKESPMVFSSSRWKRVTTIGGIYGPMYFTNKRDERFNVWMGETRLKDVMADVMLTSYDMCTQAPVFFKSHKARENPEKHDFLLQDCVKAAIAAPTVWDPYELKDALYMDALHAKNPSMFGLLEAQNHYKVDPSDVILLTLGTGHARKKRAPSSIITSGFSYFVDIFNNLINANTLSTMYMVRSFIKNDSQVLDLDPALADEHMGITDIGKEHLNYMIKVTQEYMSEHEDEMLSFARQLLPESEWKKVQASLETPFNNEN